MNMRPPCLLPVLLSLALTGCAAGPDYQRPAMEIPAAYKEAGQWKPAEPRDQQARGPWWEIYGDADLNALVAQVTLANQNVQAAAAQYRQALTALGAARASYVPSVSGNLSASRGQGTSASTTGSATVTPGAPIRDTDRLALSVSWELDLWGRIGRNVEANEAAAQAGAADLQAAQLSAQATLVQTYLQLRVNDAQQHLLEQTVAAYRRSLEITQHRYAAGVAGRVDVAQAETQLQSTQAQLVDLGAQRAQLEHAIAVLIGKTPAEFALQATHTLPALPPLPASLPSALLERRPDIAAAERRMAAANAQIGIAQAAFFPALTLGTSLGYQNNSFSQLLTQPNRFWSLGPSLALTLFDGGARTAQTEGAIAAYDKSVAGYRQTALTAFQEVEDNLAALRILADEAVLQDAAARSAAESLALTENQYRAGTVSYLNIVSTQAAALGAARSQLDIAGRRLLASALLMKALGGDWPAR